MVCGIVVDGFCGWGGGMTTTSGCLDAAGCGGPFSELGGGGGGGYGGCGGYGVGE